MQRCYIVLIVFYTLATAAHAQVYWQSDFGPWGGQVNDLCEDHDGYLHAATMQGVFLSTDEGASWQREALDGEEVYVVHRTRRGTLLVMVANHLMRSSDGGKHWSDSTALAEDLFQYSVYARSGFFEHSSGAVFCKHGALSLVSIDDGALWERLPDDWVDDHIDRWTEAENGMLLTGHRYFDWPDRTPRNFPDALFDGVRRQVTIMLSIGHGRRLSARNNGLYLSLDGGATFSLAAPYGDARDVMFISVSQTGSIFLEHAQHGFVFSLDGGVTWKKTADPPAGIKNVQDVFCTSRGAMFVATNECGILRYMPEQDAWKGISERMVLAPASRLLPLPGDRAIAATPLSEELQLLTPPDSWESLEYLDVPVADFAHDNSGTIFAATLGRGLLRSTDEGKTWSAVPGTGNECSAILLLRDGRMLLTSGSGARVSRDGGMNWEEIPQLRDAVLECAIERNNGTIVVGGEEGIYIGSPDLVLWRSSRPSWMPVMTLAENPAGALFAGTLEDGMYRSRDGGDTWSHVGLDALWITGISAPHSSYCFAATRTEGMFESRDGGGSWRPYSAGLRSEEILDLVDGTDGHLYVGTVRGISRSMYPVLRSEYHEPDFTLLQNSPNPATSQTVFAWSVPRAGSARMSLFDVLGRELVVFFDSEAAPGMHWQAIDTGTLVPGTYFCVLVYEGQRLDRKFQIVR